MKLNLIAVLLFLATNLVFCSAESGMFQALPFATSQIAQCKPIQDPVTGTIKAYYLLFSVDPEPSWSGLYLYEVPARGGGYKTISSLATMKKEGPETLFLDEADTLKVISRCAELRSLKNKEKMSALYKNIVKDVLGQYTPSRQSQQLREKSSKET